MAERLWFADLHFQNFKMGNSCLNLAFAERSVLHRYLYRTVRNSTSDSILLGPTPTLSYSTYYGMVQLEFCLVVSMDMLRENVPRS